ncbi:kinase-like protein [Annulohypoxylon maeteangense]|uniref:kinase-like protein n=1 Tax=Annulohypoxylon maeteangense TaxID=1927788 RepID=UPI002008D595|nr:kinase-like protein [Annulohypoxylon maeteangense]KAI0890043.1 kinase-like protein [Annulohypoxylon maeteangense]
MADRLLASKQAADVDALTPRDANAQRLNRAMDAVKPRAAPATKPVPKEKELPPQPPPVVYEPPSFDRKDGAAYQVGKMLGKGGFAVCYEGYIAGSKTRRKYALKIVKSKMPSKMEQKFQTELQIHSKMKHRNIVQFLRAFSFENCTYLILELCPNGSLMDMVKRRKGLTEPEVRFYSVQVAGAIKYMHAKGIIHRDLKMGNIFLDKDMNAKVGDFGLAALLVTGKDMQTIRRTTLCGTPNYIAPEILEKGKKGHDHMVDIWSLGIIMFAMLTSKPPFQSSTPDEIYRRAKNRDYDWPKAETTNKYISQEVKDIVATMLEEAEFRPDPDTIVQHDFFLSGYLPTSAEITTKLRDYPPEGDQFYTVDLTPRMVAQNQHTLREMCRACEVGPWNSTQSEYKSTWREVALEEKAGLTPIIPLAEGIVYRPYEEVSQEQNLVRVPSRPVPQPGMKNEEEGAGAQAGVNGLLRAPPQSFAAQQRAQNRPAKQPSIPRSRTVDEMPEPSASGTMRSRSRRELPQSSTENNLRLKTTLPSRAAPLTSSHRTIAAKAPASASVPEEKVLSQKKSAERVEPSTSATETPPVGTLFGPTERKMAVPGTEADVVLERLRTLHGELERALNARSMAYMSKSPTPSPPHIVVKWVDYSNKFGLGYILNDGSVGCVLKSIPGSAKGGKAVALPPSCILVREAEQHCSRRHDPGYPDRNQIVPMAQAVQFYENNGETGLSTVFVHPSQFKISVGPDGTPGKIPVGRDIFDYRKREHLILWKKFANYMMAYGRDQDATTDDTGLIQVPTSTKQTMPPCDVVTFYQRIGDVGCWVFADGHLQFNFPDHTKIVLDATGTWCHFWHLPQEAAEKLATTGELDETALDERAVLSYPLQTLLNFAAKPTIRPTRNATRKRPDINPMLQGIPAANDFRRKIGFIKRIIHEWVTNGGLGNSKMAREHRQQWTGARETLHSQPTKHVWVTIGARWGDARYSALVDPKRPGELGSEVESKTSS